MTISPPPTNSPRSAPQAPQAPGAIPTIGFLDVPVLLERSQPAARVGWFWYGLGVFLLVVLLSAYANTLGPQAAVAVKAISGASMLALIVAMAAFTLIAVRRQREEQLRLEAVEELIALRRWPEAGLLLEHMLSEPTRTPQARVQALIYLATVLSRYHRFDDAIAVQNHLLESYNLDESTSHAVRLGRAMAMLREDHLFDADRAIADLRRRRNVAAREIEAEADESASSGGNAAAVGNSGGNAARNATPGAAITAAPLTNPADSAGLALIEIYRDVKTGHPAEAIELFTARLPLMRRQLGHRVADAYILAAKSYDLLSRTDEAQAALDCATVLAPLGELTRRYPEVQSLAEKYRVAPAPAEAA